MDYDLKIVNGLIVDGTGSAGVHGDLGIRDGHIVALGKAPGQARQTIDATGQVIAPGFVDVHTHYDAQVLWDRMLTISPWHGVTSIVMGNCGFGIAPTRPAHREMIVRTLETVEGMSFDDVMKGLGDDWGFESFPQYLDLIEQRGTAINVGALAGHTAIRTYVMGEEATERYATEGELAKMRALLREAMDAGAIGFSSSNFPSHFGYKGKPVPSRLAAYAETRAMARVLGEAGRGIFQSTPGPEVSFDQYVEIATDNHVPVTWTGMFANLALQSVDYREQLARSEALADQGYRIHAQVSARPLNFEFQMKAPVAFGQMAPIKDALRQDSVGQMRLYADPAFRDAFRAAFADVNENLIIGFRQTVIVGVVDPSLAERKLFDVAQERGVDPADLMFDLALKSKLEERFRIPLANHIEDECQRLLFSKGSLLALSDAGAHVSQLCDAVMPTYFLGHWHREKQAVILEKAVWMLTGRPAEIFGLADRGRLAVNRPADVVVFDPATVHAAPMRRIHDLPNGGDRLVADAIGVNTVVVNGAILRRDGRDVLETSAALPGRLLRGGRASVAHH